MSLEPVSIHCDRSSRCRHLVAWPDRLLVGARIHDLDAHPFARTGNHDPDLARFGTRFDAVMHGASPGGVQHWHLERLGATDLQLVRFYRPMAEDSLDHLPFWIEDDLPEHGTDLIAIEPYRIEPDHELSPVIRSRLASITSQVGGLLLRILEEEGWRVPRSGQRRARKGDGKAA